MSELPSQQFQRYHFDKVCSIAGLVEQLCSLTNELYIERKRLEEVKSNSKTETFHPTPDSIVAVTPIILTTLEEALKTSIVFFQFSIIEAIVSTLGELTENICSQKYYTPLTTLSQAELDFILEINTYFDATKGKTVQKSSFKKLEDKISMIPELFAKMMGKEFKLDKSGVHWQRFVQLKILRDLLTHPKGQLATVTDQNIFEGSTVLYWLAEEYFGLIRDTLYPNDNFPYKNIEITTIRLVSISYYATFKKYDVSLYAAKHKKLSEQNPNNS